MISKNKINLRHYNEEFVQTLITLGTLIVFVTIISILAPNFLRLENINNVLIQVSLVMLTGVAVTMLLVSGYFDLSVGGVLALAGVLYALFCQMDVPTYVSIFLGVLSGTIFGFINAFLVVKMRITAVIATIGTMYMARGIANILADGSMIESGLPINFRNISTMSVGPINLVLLIVIVVVLIFLFIQKKAVFGRFVYCIGTNKNAAQLSGIDVETNIFILYMIVGTMASFSGVVLAAKLGAGISNVGQGFELDTIAAAVIGGASISGGKGSVLSTIIGAIIIGIIANALNLLNLYSDYQFIIKGLVIIAAILLQRVVYSKIFNTVRDY